ncbi:MAG: hypothetical protein WBM83_10480 [Flavobacteriaceae bacterium]
MKRFLKTGLLLLLSVYALEAQEFESGTNAINLGLGLGGSYGTFTTSSVSPGISVSYERGIWDIGGPGVISLGGYVGTKSYKYDYFDNSSKWTYTTVGVRGAYHFNGLEVENLDVYGGAMLAYNIANFSGDSVAFEVASTIRPTFFVGGRWYFNDTFGVFAEAGYGVAYLTIGGVLRF